MNVLLVKPGEAPRAVELEGSLSSMQAVVGGSIQAVYPFQEPVAPEPLPADRRYRRDL